GEFSFILAALGRQLGLLTDVATNALVATSIISITLNPILYRMIDPVHRWAERQRAVREVFRFCSRARKQVEDEMQVHDEQRKRIAPQAVVVGYGPVGKIVVRLLQGNGLRVHVVEMNLETVRSLNAEGIHALYGDISVPSTLEDAGIASASSLILSSTSVPNAKEVVREAKELNPQIRILARSAYARESVELRNAGCDVVFSGEGEVAFAMLEEILRDFGSTTAELVQERVRAREELYGNSDT
ncbi:MAG: NAD-binding protein, partial [Deltaproteobacteria bacterium]|nr:NAD-binding protein [Deltaproteobacteria bacterium]